MPECVHARYASEAAADDRRREQGALADPPPVMNRFVFICTKKDESKDVDSGKVYNHTLVHVHLQCVIPLYCGYVRPLSVYIIVTHVWL